MGEIIHLSDKRAARRGGADPQTREARAIHEAYVAERLPLLTHAWNGLLMAARSLGPISHDFVVPRAGGVQYMFASARRRVPLPDMNGPVHPADLICGGLIAGERSELSREITTLEALRTGNIPELHADKNGLLSGEDVGDAMRSFIERSTTQFSVYVVPLAGDREPFERIATRPIDPTLASVMGDVAALGADVAATTYAREAQTTQQTMSYMTSLLLPIRRTLAVG